MKNNLRFSILSLPVVVIIAFASCQKDTTPVDAPAASKLELMTRNVFIYDSLFNNWGLPNQTTVYVRNGTNNSANWSNERVKFYRDGTFDEILVNGTWRQGNWSMNSDSTILTTSGAGYSNTATILTLTSAKLVWYDNINKSRGVQIPKN